MKTSRKKSNGKEKKDNNTAERKLTGSRVDSIKLRKFSIILKSKEITQNETRKQTRMKN